MLRSSLFIILTALFCASVRAGPLAPTGSWEVNKSAVNCIASRAFGDIRLIIEPAPLGKTSRYSVEGPGRSESSARQFPSQIDAFDNGPAIKATSLIYPLAKRGRRGMTIVLSNADAARVEKSARLRILTRGKLVKGADGLPNAPQKMEADLMIGSTSALKRVLDSCMSELHAYWGMVNGEFPEPAKRPVLNLYGIFRSGDYPADAMAEYQGGQTQYLLMIDERGTLLDCVTEKTSGVASLNAMGCQVIRERAKILPAMNAKGQPVKSVYRTPLIHWQIAK